VKEIEYKHDKGWVEMRFGGRSWWFAAYTDSINKDGQPSWHVLYEANGALDEYHPVAECSEGELRGRIFTKCLLLGVFE